jgi:hypothetical protein
VRGTSAGRTGFGSAARTARTARFFSAPKSDDSGVPVTEDAEELRLGDEARQ